MCTRGDSMSDYIHDDCLCGYATHSTKSCQQKDCSNYLKREVKMGQIEMQNENKRQLDLFTKRVTKAVLKE